MSNCYAVIGYPVEHSLSPMIHQLFALQTGVILTYKKMMVQPDGFEQHVAEFFRQGGKGLNITLPYKERAFSFAAHVTSRCFKAKAANTLWQDENGIQADNTDGIGLLRDLAHYIDISGKDILLLGAGGAARGILGPLLASNPAQLTLVNRTPEKARILSQDFYPAINRSVSALDEAFDLVINATSTGLSKQDFALSSSILKPTTVCYDLAYNINASTPFVAWGQDQGCTAIDGLGMLVEQAAEAFSIWHGVMPDAASVLLHLRNSPGQTHECSKNTI